MMFLEFASSKAASEAMLYAKTEIIVEHIIYLILDPTNINRNHWKQEIAGFLSSVSKLKTTKKFPSRDFIYDNTYGALQDCISDEAYMGVWFKDICSEENIDFNYIENNYDTIIDKIDSVCMEYFNWISDKLSVSGRVDKHDIYTKLDELL